MVVAKKKTEARKNSELEYIVKAEHEYKDDRGSIDYFILPEAVNWVGVINTVKGSIRANHFHPKQEQKVLIIFGKCICLYKDLDAKDAPILHHLAKSGDLVVTCPRVAHAVIYLEDTLFLNLVNGERDPTNYGKHTITYPLVDKESAKKYIAMYEGK